MTTLEIVRAAKEASRTTAMFSGTLRNQALCAMAVALREHCDAILAENARDMEHAREKGKAEAFLDRLLLTEARVAAMADGVRSVASLPDPLGQMQDVSTRPNGLVIGKRRVPLGCVAIIYEARPNVTADSIALCLKSGNAVVLRGGSEAICSNTAIANVMREAAKKCGVPGEAIGLIEDTTRQSAQELMHADGLVDVLIPRGGRGLIDSVVKEASVPVIQTGAGVCHVYVDATADADMACDIIVNAKCSRPSVCNAAETLLVHRAIARFFLPQCLARLVEEGVEIRACEKTRQLFPELAAASEEDWATEYGELILSVKIVDSLEDAVDHIAKYGTGHSEAIVTQELACAQRFLDLVDAAAVYVNASTRFTDGFEFGYGAEIGISTQKLHARGPMGLEALTSYKYIVIGSGQIR